MLGDRQQNQFWPLETTSLIIRALALIFSLVGSNQEVSAKPFYRKTHDRKLLLPVQPYGSSFYNIQNMMSVMKCDTHHIHIRPNEFKSASGTQLQQLVKRQESSEKNLPKSICPNNCNLFSFFKSWFHCCRLYYQYYYYWLPLNVIMLLPSSVALSK